VSQSRLNCTLRVREAQVSTISRVAIALLRRPPLRAPRKFRRRQNAHTCAMANAHCLRTLYVGKQQCAQSFNFTSVDVLAVIAQRDCTGERHRRINPGGTSLGVYTDAVGKSNGFLLSGGHLQRLMFRARSSVRRSSGHGRQRNQSFRNIVGQFTAPYNPPLSTSVGFDSPAIAHRGSTAASKAFSTPWPNSHRIVPGSSGGDPGAASRPMQHVWLPDGLDVMASMFSAA